MQAAGLRALVCRLRFCVPHLNGEIADALTRAKQRLGHACVDGTDWYWPSHERPKTKGAELQRTVRFLAPFDPIVWDRGRFEIFWSWAYRFEAYMPPQRRKLGYYALPLLWRDAIIGWVNLAASGGTLTSQPGFATRRRPRSAEFNREYEAELERMRTFLSL